MRIKLYEKGLGTKITIIGQYRRGSGGHLCLADVSDFETGEYLCDHLWIEKPYVYSPDFDPVPYRKPNDFFICTGTILEYSKRTETDYGVFGLSGVKLIKPFVFNERIVYLPFDKYRLYWFFRGREGYSGDEMFSEDYSRVLHLFSNHTPACFDPTEEMTGEPSEESKGYEILEETERYYHICYRQSDLIVYKSLEGAKEELRNNENQLRGECICWN